MSGAKVVGNWNKKLKPLCHQNCAENEIGKWRLSGFFLSGAFLNAEVCPDKSNCNKRRPRFLRGSQSFISFFFPNCDQKVCQPHLQTSAPIPKLCAHLFSLHATALLLFNLKNAALMYIKHYKVWPWIFILLCYADKKNRELGSVWGFCINILRMWVRDYCNLCLHFNSVYKFEYKSVIATDSWNSLSHRLVWKHTTVLLHQIGIKWTCIKGGNF